MSDCNSQAAETMNESAVTVRMTKAEAALLTRFATETGRTKTDILREAIRALEISPQAPAKKRRAAKHASR